MAKRSLKITEIATKIVSLEVRYPLTIYQNDLASHLISLRLAGSYEDVAL